MFHARAIRGTAVLVFAGMLAGAPAEARAGTPAETEATQEQASKLFRQGNAAFEQKRWAEAEAAYREAWKLARTFDIAANLGEASLHLHKPREAARYLAFSLRSAPPSAKAAQRDRTRHFLDEAKKEVGTLRLRLSVPDARVTIDGAPVDQDDLAGELFVDPGSHTIVAQREGYEGARAIIRATAGSTQEVPLSLPLHQERRSVVPGVVLGSVAGAALVTGIGLFAGGKAKGASVADVHEAILGAHGSCVSGAANFDARCAEAQHAAATANTFQKVGVGLLATAGVAAAATAIYFALPQPAATKTSAIYLAPTVARGATGFVVAGTF